MKDLALVNLSISFLLCLPFVSHCGPSSLIRESSFRSSIQNDQQALSALEQLRRHVEEWGVVTVSGSAITRNASAFSVGDDSSFETTKEYIQYARTHVQGGVTEQVSTYSGAALDAKMQAAAAAGKTAEDILTDPNNKLTEVQQITPPAGDAGISNRTAVTLGINDKITEKMLRYMAAPPEENSDYSVDFAIVQVSVNPGWRTQENYVADVSATCMYQRSGRDESITSDEYGPTVFSVLPLLDAQTLELASTDRMIIDLVAKLATTYPSAAGRIDVNALLRFVKTYQQSASSRSPITVTNSYSTGPTFGFHIAPSFIALNNPAAKRSGTANRMIATTFPAMVTLAHSNKYFPSNHKVVVDIVARWLIYQRPKLAQWGARLSLPLKRQDEALRLEVARRFDDLDAYLMYPLQKRDYDVSRTSDVYGDRPQEEHTLLRDFRELKAKTIDQTRISLSLPNPGKTTVTRHPELQKLTPSKVPEKGGFVLELTGSDLYDPLAATIGSSAATRVLFVNPKTCLAEFPEIPAISEGEAQPELTLFVKGSNQPKPLPITVPVRPKPTPAIKTEPSIQINQNNDYPPSPDSSGPTPLAPPKQGGTPDLLPPLPAETPTATH